MKAEYDLLELVMGVPGDLRKWELLQARIQGETVTEGTAKGGHNGQLLTMAQP